MRIRPFAQGGSALKCASSRTFVNPSSGHESRAASDELAARSFAQGSAKNSNIFNRFALFFEYFRIFSNVFECFRIFSNATCAFDATPVRRGGFPHVWSPMSPRKILMCFCLIGRRVRKTPAFDRVGLQV